VGQAMIGLIGPDGYRGGIEHPPQATPDDLPSEGTAPLDGPQAVTRGGGVLSTAFAVLLMAALGALMRVAFDLLR
jgi:hypothetical protein